MNSITQAQYDNLETAISSLKNCHENMVNIFNKAKADYDEMPYESKEASQLKNIFDTETVSSFNRCCADIVAYIGCLEVTKQQYIAANQASLNN